MIRMFRRCLMLVAVAVLTASGWLTYLGGTAGAFPELAFPIIGSATFSNDFNSPRSNGPHHATDIFAPKGRKIVSRTDGVITFVANPQPSWGYAVFIEAPNGYEYRYLHLNNDTPGTDDGKGGLRNAYAPDVRVGNRVKKGQHIGYVGDSGNAETTTPHLHLEAYDGNRALNPYPGLKENAKHLTRPILDGPRVMEEFLPHPLSYMNGGRLASGELNGEPGDELVVSPGKEGASVRTFTGAGTQIARFEPYGGSFKGGFDVATGDINNDGIDEIITGAGPGGNRLKVFSAVGEELTSFTPYTTSFKGGFDVATGDINNDGIDEIITGAGTGGSTVRVFDSAGDQLAVFSPYGEDFKQGISVASGNVSGNGAQEIVTGAKATGRPRVSTFLPNGTLIASWYVYETNFRGGVRVEVGELDSGQSLEEVMTIPQSEGLPRARMFSANGSDLGYTNYFAEEWAKNQYDITVTSTGAYSIMGVGRRTSVRPITGL